MIQIVERDEWQGSRHNLVDIVVIKEGQIKTAISNLLGHESQ